MTYRVFTSQVENGETGRIEEQRPCQCGGCKGEGRPLFPGDPDRHDAGAGDRVVLVVAVDSASV